MKAEFESTKLLGKVVGIFLLLSMLDSVITFILTVVEYNYFRGVLQSEAELESGALILALFYFMSALLTFFVFIGAATFFLMWFYRSYKNLQAFNVQSLTTTPGWAVGYWFIPILNLYYPFRSVNEVYNGSDPDLSDERTRFSDTSSTGFHTGWWILWVAGSIIGNVSFRVSMNSTRQGDLDIVSILDMLLQPIWILCAFMAFEIVKDITERQELIGQKLKHNTPPQPPSFGEPQNETV